MPFQRVCSRAQNTVAADHHSEQQVPSSSMRSAWQAHRSPVQNICATHMENVTLAAAAPAAMIVAAAGHSVKHKRGHRRRRRHRRNDNQRSIGASLVHRSLADIPHQIDSGPYLAKNTACNSRLLAFKRLSHQERLK